MTGQTHDTDSWKQIEALFAAAMERDPSERQAFVNEMCGSQVELRRELEEMLAAAEESDEFLESPAIAASPPTNGSEHFPESIGGYRIKRVIASGGMGSVFRAVRSDEHFEQQVAVKLIRGTILNDAMRGRFHRERQTLAQFEHPYITRLIDGGQTQYLL